MSTIYASYPVTSGSVQIPEYANFAAFPGPTTVPNGTFAFALDTGILYESNGVVWRAIGGPGVALSIGTFDSGTPSANGAHIDSNALIMQSASATVPGEVNNTTQSFSGPKTFTGLVTANTNIDLFRLSNGIEEFVYFTPDGAISPTNLEWSIGQKANDNNFYIRQDNGSTVTDVIDLTANGFVVLNAQLNLPNLTPSTVLTLDSFNTVQSTAIGDLTDVGTDGITVTGGTGAVLGSGTSLAQHVADTSHNGYLSSTDWNTFNGKQAALTIGNLTDVGTDGITVTGGTGAVIGTGTSFAQHVADTTHNGYLSSTDWNTFNGKGAGSVTSVGVSGGTTGLTTSGGPITGSGTITLAGTLAIASGGTGAGTKAGAFDALSPMLTAGDMIYGGTAGTGTVLATGVTAGVLHGGNAAVPSWSLIVNADVSASAAIDGSKLVAAASGVTGAITAGTQTITGIKTFETQLIGKGTGTNDSAPAGYIGEYFTASGSSVSINTSTWTTVASLGTLTAGDWDISATLQVNGVSSITGGQIAISTATNAATGVTSGINRLDAFASVGLGAGLSIPCWRVTIANSATQAYFLVGACTGANTTAGGAIHARRVR